VTPVSVADLPTIHGAFRAHAFRGAVAEHLALVSGRKLDLPLVRLHSECLTGDGLGSLRCDCGPQLQEAMRRIAASDGGILLYLRGQEGRGIGLANKMRAYALQDQGMDTHQANLALGLPADGRSYEEAAAMLLALGAGRVRLLTNNPDKVAALQAHGVEVVETVPLIMPPNPFNAAYLQTKAQKFGHLLP
jgi:3,4-dihydroxy 2-butanone 4-phosphate synthase/GTP cyclohydrolase II